MGYTHYFRSQGISATDWAKILEVSKRIISDGRLQGLLCFESDLPEHPPLADESMIRFNGRGKDGHETFLITPVADDFNFCKTAQKGYDTAVVAVLIAVKHYSPWSIQISSDGDLKDWLPGLAIVNDIMRDTDGVEIEEAVLGAWLGR